MKRKRNAEYQRRFRMNKRLKEIGKPTISLSTCAEKMHSHRPIIDEKKKLQARARKLKYLVKHKPTEADDVIRKLKSNSALYVILCFDAGIGVPTPEEGKVFSNQEDLRNDERYSEVCLSFLTLVFNIL